MASDEGVKQDRAKVCTAQLTFQSTFIAFGLSVPAAFYYKKTWPLMIGFVGGTLYDMWKWQECVNAPAEIVQANLKALEPRLSSSESSLAAKVAKDFDELEQRKSNPKKE
jgi:hypothetical protein